MADSQLSGWCKYCQQQQLMVKPRINHVLHLILTLVTLGVWGIVWIGLGLMSALKRYRCSQCGTPAGKTPKRAKQPSVT